VYLLWVKRAVPQLVSYGVGGGETDDWLDFIFFYINILWFLAFKFFKLLNAEEKIFKLYSQIEIKNNENSLIATREILEKMSEIPTSI